MNKICMFVIYAAIAVTLAGCGTTTINPNYTSTNPELMRIGGETPGNKEPELLQLGSYCLQVQDKWKADGKTPDGQMIWTKDSFRKVAPCK
jgi:hypothetical protein